MSLETALGETGRRIHRQPALLLVGVAVATLSLGLAVLLDVLTRSAVPTWGGVLAPLVVALSSPLVLPLAVGIYEPVRNQPASARATLVDAAAAVRRQYRRLLVADLAGAAVAGAVGVGVVAAWYVVETSYRWSRHVVANPPPVEATEPVVSLGGAFAVGLAVGGLCVNFADVVVLAGDGTPWRAWRSSLEFARRRPLALAGYGLVVVVANALGLVGVSIPPLLVSAPLPSLAVRLVGAVLVGGAATTTVAAFHVVYYDRVVRPTLPSSPPTTRRLPWKRVAVVGLVLTAGVGGAAAVRTVDPDPGRGTVDELPADPVAAYRVAVDNTAGSNYRRALYVRNASNGSEPFRVFTRTGVDYDDRQLYVYFGNPGGDSPVRGSYFGETVYALYNTGGVWRGPFALNSGNWSAIPFPTYYLGGGGSGPIRSFPDPAVDWTVARNDSSTVVLRVSDPAAIRAAFRGQSHAGMGGNMSDDSYLSVTVDRDRGVVEGADFHLHSVDTGRNRSYRVRYTEVGTADLTRPPQLGSRGPIEWGIDALYY